MLSILEWLLLGIVISPFLKILLLKLKQLQRVQLDVEFKIKKTSDLAITDDQVPQSVRPVKGDHTPKKIGNRPPEN